MSGGRRFERDWEPVVLADRVLAEGSWCREGVVQHEVRLWKRTWDYSRADIEAIEIAVADSINLDYIDYAINEEGNVFFWEIGARDCYTTSNHFSSFEAAKEHFYTFAGPSEIRWYVNE